ncbi:hypothetical protein OIU76_028583 [Salix suchowensis]|nr:hypothetical protein OIU76_028583 [Salix suchowensis]
MTKTALNKHTLPTPAHKHNTGRPGSRTHCGSVSEARLDAQSDEETGCSSLIRRSSFNRYLLHFNSNRRLILSRFGLFRSSVCHGCLSRHFDFPSQTKPAESPRSQTQQRNPEPIWRQPQQKLTEPTKQPTPLNFTIEPNKQSTSSQASSELTRQLTPLKAATESNKQPTPSRAPSEPTLQPTPLTSSAEPNKLSTPSKITTEPTRPEVVIGLSRSAPKVSATDSTRQAMKHTTTTTTIHHLCCN